jgi:hypothetical protein
MSAETREKIGASQRGKVISEDVRQKISVANTGKKRTDEAKEKLRKLAMQNIETFRKNAHLGPISLSKKVICLDDGTVFESASAAARAYGLKKATSISDVCSGKPSRTRAAGRRFKYLEAA